MAEAAAFVASFPVGRKYTVTLTVRCPQDGEVVCSPMEWSPRVPKRLTKAELRDYRRGRNKAFAELAAQSGIEVLIAEL